MKHLPYHNPEFYEPEENLFSKNGAFFIMFIFSLIVSFIIGRIADTSAKILKRLL